MYSILYLLYFQTYRKKICFQLQWDESKSTRITIQEVLIEAQKQIEKAFLEQRQWGQHPYSLSIDLINTTICNLVTQGILILHENQNLYLVNKIEIIQILAQLQNLSLKRPLGSYLNAILLPLLPPPVSAKL